MYFDHHGAIALEQSAFPGSIGDSCAETSRYLLVSNPTFGQLAVIWKFETPEGYVRHPESPWREDDFSGDQALPLYLVFDWYGLGEERERFENRLRDNGWKTGNGDYISPLFMSAIRRAHGRQNWLTDLPILFHALGARYFPYRWSDSKKTIERNDDHTADWLNYYHVLLQAKRRGPTWVSRLAAKITPHSMIMEKIKSYYAIEPNHQFLIDAYQSNPI